MLRSKSIRRILIEVCPINLRQLGFTPRGLFKVILDSGYEPYELSQRVGGGRRLEADDFDGMVLENVLLLPAGPR